MNALILFAAAAGSTALEPVVVTATRREEPASEVLASVDLITGIRCTPPGGRLKVSVKIRKRADRPRPRVRRIVFFVRKGPRKVDRRRPWVKRLRLNRPAGSRGRVFARAFYKRKGSRKVHRKTVSKRFVMCG